LWMLATEVDSSLLYAQGRPFHASASAEGRVRKVADLLLSCATDESQVGLQ
jgi:hypothetical protein